MNEPTFWQHLFRLFWGAGCFLTLASVRGEDSPFRGAAERNFRQAQNQYLSQTQSTLTAWQYARACFDLADCATNKAERARIASQGIQVSQQALAHDSNSAPARYYYGMNLAQLAQTKGLGALKIVRQMEREFSSVRERDEHLDYAGADRNLGLLYRDAPSLGSIGDRTKAKQHLVRAVELAPDYPENRLNLIETYLKWGQRDAARPELERLEDLWPKARAKLSGPEWASSWADWDRRFNELRQRLKESGKR
jgi:tetratricopeptide (TPR) repeat protein